MWSRLLVSGQKVSYDHLPLGEVAALKFALDEWEALVHIRQSLRQGKKPASLAYTFITHSPQGR